MFRIFKRNVHAGHVKRVLNKRKELFSGRYSRIFADQRERVDHLLQGIRYEKDAVVRELLHSQNVVTNLLNDCTDKPSQNQKDPDVEFKRRNDAYRIYRMLRPDAPTFFEEQTSLHLSKSMNQLLQKPSTESTTLVLADPSNVLDNKEPVFTTDCYILAVSSLIESITDDIQDFCAYIGIKNLPEKNAPNRFLLIFDALVDFIKLRSDGSDVDKWVEDVWSAISKLFIKELGEISNQEMSKWLKEHLIRVAENKAISGKPKDEWYSLHRDILYDALPYPETIKIENKLGYPFKKAHSYFNSLLSLFDISEFALEHTSSFLESLKGIGLLDWFKLKPNEIEESMLGNISKEHYPNKEDLELSSLLIDTLARNMDHLLNIETYSPTALLSFVHKSYEDSVKDAPEHPWLPEKDIKQIITNRLQTITKVENQDVISNDINNVLDTKKTPLDEIIEDEEKYSRSIGPGIISVDDEGKCEFKWKVPAGAQYDKKRGIYVRMRSTADPQFILNRFRFCVLDRRRMRSMTREGRVYFVRVVTAVGNGDGYIGFGVGFGNDISSASTMSTEAAFKNMFFVDFDPKEVLTTPVRAKEYGATVTITPKPFGSGITINRKFLPLAYIIGLDNVRITFHGSKSWITRAAALRRALESIYSRKTACNMTGNRYIYHRNPGDHTIHWPDEWFVPISEEYKQRIATIKRNRIREFKSSIRRRYSLLTPYDISPGRPKYADRRFMSPLEKLSTDIKYVERINTDVSKSMLQLPLLHHR